MAAVLPPDWPASRSDPRRDPATTVAARNPAVEVRTQVIRRTIHIVRHQAAAHAAGRIDRHAGGPPPAREVGASRGQPLDHPGASHRFRGVLATRPAVRTPPRAGPAAGSAPVTTRTSARAPASGEPAAGHPPDRSRLAPAPPSVRSGGGSAAAGAPVTTRTSARILGHLRGVQRPGDDPHQRRRRTVATMATGMADDEQLSAMPSAASRRRPRTAGASPVPSPGPDRLTVVLFSVAALPGRARAPRHPAAGGQPRAARIRCVVLRKIYRTTVVETIDRWQRTRRHLGNAVGLELGREQLLGRGPDDAFLVDTNAMTANSITRSTRWAATSGC